MFDKFNRLHSVMSVNPFFFSFRDKHRKCVFLNLFLLIDLIASKSGQLQYLSSEAN